MLPEQTSYNHFSMPMSISEATPSRKPTTSTTFYPVMESIQHQLENTSRSFRVSWKLVVWFLLIAVSVYAFLFVIYQYRVSDGVSVMQCEADTFHKSLLNERQPLVCRGLDSTSTWKIYNIDTTAELNQDQESALYSNFSSVAPWFSQNEEAVTVHENPIAPSASPKQVDNALKQNLSDVCLLIQARGDASVCVVHPSDYEKAKQVPQQQHSKLEEADFTEIIVRKGCGVFVPFRWWYRTTPIQRVNPRQQQQQQHTTHHVLKWRSLTTRMCEPLRKGLSR